jgi:hypothetical protein
VGDTLVWLQKSAKDGDARFEECGLGVVREYEMELLTLVAETLTMGILERPIEVMQLVEIVEEARSKFRYIYGLVVIVSARSRTACSRAASSLPVIARALTLP